MSLFPAQWFPLISTEAFHIITGSLGPSRMEDSPWKIHPHGKYNILYEWNFLLNGKVEGCFTFLEVKRGEFYYNHSSWLNIGLNRIFVLPLGLAGWVLVGEGEKNYAKLKRKGKRKKDRHRERKNERKALKWLYFKFWCGNDVCIFYSLWDTSENRYGPFCWHPSWVAACQIMGSYKSMLRSIPFLEGN